MRRRKLALACATSVLVQLGVPVFAGDLNELNAASGSTASAPSALCAPSGTSDSSNAVDPSNSAAMSSSSQGASPAELVSLEIMRDGLASPLVYSTPDMSLNAAYLLPIGDPANLLKGAAKAPDSTDGAPDTKPDTSSDPRSDSSSDLTVGEDSNHANKKAESVGSGTGDGPIVIDNDLEKEIQITEYVWKEIPDSEGKMHIDAGGRFPVTVVTSHTSKTAKVGDPVEARLKVDIKIGGRLIAPKGAKVIGHIASCEKARKMIQAEFSMKRWMRPSGSLGVQFDEILTASGDHIPLVATPARQPRIVKNMAEGRVLGVNHKGEIVSPLSSQVKSQAAHLGIRAAASAAGPFSFGIVPVAYGVAGAISPSFAFMHPVGKNVRHRRLKGFGLGVVSGLPGGFLVADSIIRGDEAIIKPGDEFLAEFKQKFTGEASTDAQLMPNAKVKVHGEVLPGATPSEQSESGSAGKSGTNTSGKSGGSRGKSSSPSK